MNTKTKENINFGVSKEQEIQNPYAKKYMKDKYRIVIKDDVTEKVRQVKSKRGFTSDNETIRYLCDLETKVDPALRIVHRCKTCNEEIINIPQDINVNKFVHNDLCKTASCKGHIHTKSEIALNDKGFVISNKDIANGTTTAKDEVQTWNIGRDIMTNVNGVEYKNGKKVIGYRGEDPVTQEEIDAFARNMKEGPTDY